MTEAIAFEPTARIHIRASFDGRNGEASIEVTAVSLQPGFIVTLGEAVVDQGLGARYLLVDPSSGQVARFGVVFSIPL